jgi:phage gp29-like protein
MAKSPTKAQLVQQLQELEARMLTRPLETIIDHRNEPASTLSGLTADRVHAAIQQAEQGDTRDLFSVYRDCLIADPFLQNLIETRILAVIGDEVLISPADKDKPEDVAAADAIRAAIDRLPDFGGVCADLLWGTMWPMSIVERTYQPATEPGLQYDWADIAPVPDHLFRWTTGKLEIAEVSPVTRQLTGNFFTPSPTRYITHRGHLLRHPDNWGGPMRALVWLFFLKTMDREWWTRFLDKFGTPFMVGKFDKSDEKSRQILERAFKLSTKVGGVVVNKETAIELLKAGASDSAGAFKEFHAYCEDSQARRVLGQTLSSTASPTGLGQGASDLQGQVRGDIAAFDKKRLAQTLRDGLFKPWLKLNGFTGTTPKITFGGEEPEENTTTATVLKDLKDAGIRIADKSIGALSQRIGLELERAPEPTAAPPAPGPPIKTLSAPLPGTLDPNTAVHSISRRAAAMLSQAYRGTLAPARDILLTSATPAEAESRLLATFTDWDATKAAAVIESAFAAGAWNGLQ